MRTFTALAALSLAFAVPAAPAAAQSAADITVPETNVVFVAPTVDVDGYTPYDYENDETLNETLEDADVYSSITLEEIGNVDDVFLGVGDVPTYLKLDIGGWLDIGDRDIVVPLDQVSVYSGTDDFRIYIEATEEQIEDYPEYD